MHDFTCSDLLFCRAPPDVNHSSLVCLCRDQLPGDLVPAPMSAGWCGKLLLQVRLFANPAVVRARGHGTQR